MKSKTIEFFKEISKIPRESGNEREISNYICEFAKKRNLEYFQDKYNNVIIKKYTGKNEPIILQAHIDMVCEKESNLEFDFEKDSIDIYEENGFLKAKGTTLGADNGVGVAQILNILDSDLEINVEAVFTVAEETTMIGAENIDVSCLTGKQMINLDGFEERTVILESAGFFDVVLNMNYDFSQVYEGECYKINLTGMEGGHSGFEIDNNKGNSCIELAKLMNELGDIKIFEFIGGTKFNVIPSQAECKFFSSLDFETINEIARKFEEIEKQKYLGLNVQVNHCSDKGLILSEDNSKRFLKAVCLFKNGVLFKNEIGQVTTSHNLGVVNLKEKVMKIGVRSSRKVEEKEILDYLRKYSKENGFEFKILGMQPGFETKKDSRLVKRLISAYENATGRKDLELKAVHITVEAGFFKEKIEELDVAIISPKIFGAHTTKEMVEIKSVEECDKWLENFLKNS